jgi:hypothetical protein
VDGYARIKGDHGFIFLFSGNPRPAEITFEVGDEINLQVKGDYQFTELYPSEHGKRVLDSNGKSVFAMGERASIIVPANECYLLELKKVVRQADPVLVGIAGKVVLADGRMAITGVVGKPGEQVGIRVRVADPGAVQGITVNGVEQKFVRTEREVCLEVRFAGEKHVRELDAWARADGTRFDFPYHAAQPELKLTATFTLNADVRQLLENAKPKNFAEMDAKIADWQTNRGGSYAYHNFICERPSRLWLIVPFLTHTDFELTLNGEKVAPLRWDDPSHSAVFDLTDLVNYGGTNTVTLILKRMAPNHFMGPYLIYPEEASTDKLLPGPGAADLRVVYKQSLVPALPTRYRKNAGPKVIEAKMMENVTLKEAAELRVTLDLPPDQIKRVMFFESGFGWMGQHGLGYNKEAQCWTARVTPGPRAAIQENEHIYVWAEGTDGLRSDYYPVNVGWDFTTARNAKVVAGAIEAEFLKVQSKSGSKVEPQDMAPYGNHWSGGSQMVWWGGLEQGDSMVLEVPLEKAGVYALALHLSKAEDYGIFSVRLDDGPETEAMDFFQSKLQPPTIITLKPMTLAKGTHSLRITCHGKNPKSGNSLIGIDCLEFKETTR